MALCGKDSSIFRSLFLKILVFFDLDFLRILVFFENFKISNYFIQVDRKLSLTATVLTTGMPNSHYQSVFSLPQRCIRTTSRCSHYQSIGPSPAVAVLTTRGQDPHYRALGAPGGPLPPSVTAHVPIMRSENPEWTSGVSQGPRWPRRRAHRRARGPFLTYFNRGRKPCSSCRSTAAILQNPCMRIWSICGRDFSEFCCIF